MSTNGMLVSDEEVQTLLAASLLHSKDGTLAQDDLEQIVRRYQAIQAAHLAWEWVKSGRLGVRWSEEAQDVMMEMLSDEEAARRGRILEDVRAGKVAPPWPEGGP
jgi:hypothetical protein